MTKEFVLQMADEDFELLREINWKHHKLVKKELDYERIRLELVDIFKFWLNICIIWGVEPKDFIDAFFKKSKEVEERYSHEQEVTQGI